MDKKRKILVMAYAISPNKGSEFSVAWNYVKNMSEENDLTVLYGMSDNHMGEMATMELYIKENPISQVKFIPLSLINLLIY